MLRRALLSTGAVLLLVCAAARTPHAESNADWLERLNFYRAMSSLPPVAEDPRLSDPVQQHARYMVMHDVVQHAQSAGRRWSTPAGAMAAAVSNLAGSTRATEPDVWAIDVWMQAPFHALGILDPSLSHVGFGIHRSDNGGIQTAAGLDVIRGRSPAPAPAAYPIVWPARGAVVPIASHTDEYPSPLTSCRGYQAPTGLPLIVQLGSGQTVPDIADTRIVEGERPLEHCVFDERTYRNPRGDEQQLGRSILAARNAIVLIPRRPLTPGATYRVILHVNRQRIDWTFTVSVLAGP